MRNKILVWCREQALFPSGAHVVCAVSGGADSVAMLHALCALRAELGITVSAAHFNHRLRGAESDRDEAFVRTLCQTLGVSLSVSGADVAAHAARTGESVEEAARELRYAFFAQLDGLIATAHTADDNLETVLLNLTRGTSLRGLCGIPPKRERIVRPMLCLTRREIEAYLTENALAHVEDSTNAAPDARRNRGAKTPRLRRRRCAGACCCGRMKIIWSEPPKQLCAMRKQTAAGRARRFAHSLRRCSAARCGCCCAPSPCRSSQAPTSARSAASLLRTRPPRVCRFRAVLRRSGCMTACAFHAKQRLLRGNRCGF